MSAASFLEIIGLHKFYGAHHALRGVTLSIQRGEIIALLGVNGAGKTTLSTIIASLHAPTQGEIVFQGRSIYDNLTSYRHAVAYCPQRPNLNSSLTVYQNLYFAGCYYGMTASAIRARIESLVAALGIGRHLHKFPHQLSGGYRQRVLIARSLVPFPQLLILDEPTIALDPQVRYKLWEIIRELKRAGITVILTTHYIEEAEALADRVCVLANGKLLLVDTPKNLVAQFQKGKLEEVFIQLTQEESNAL